MKGETNHKKEKRERNRLTYSARNVISIIAVLSIFFGILIAAIIADTLAERRGREYAKATLLDSAKEQETTFVAVIDGQYKTLQTICSGIGVYGIDGNTKLEDVFKEIEGYSEFENINFINPNGTSVRLSYGINLSEREYFKASMDGGFGMEHIMGAYSGRDFVALSVPYRENGVIRGVVMGNILTENINRRLISEVYSGRGYSFMIDSDGCLIVHPEESGNTELADDIKDRNLGEYHFIDYSEKELRKALFEGGSGSFTYSKDNKEYVVAFTPVKLEKASVEPWYIFNVVPSSAFAEMLAAERNASFLQIGIVLAFGLVSIALVIRLMRNDRLALKKENELTRLHEERLKIFAAQSKRNIFYYDIATGSAHNEMREVNTLDLPENIDHMVDSIIKMGIVEKDSIEDYQRFFHAIENGDKTASADIQLILNGKRRRWYRFSSTTLFSDEGVPKTAVVSCYDCTEMRARELVYAKWQQELAAMPKDGATLQEWNLTKNVCESQSNDGKKHAKKPASFEEMVKTYSEESVFEEDREAYRAFMNRDRLIGAYYNGVYTSTFDYRDVSEFDNPRWMRINAQIVPYPESDDIKLFFVLTDINNEKREELELVARSERDAMTGLLNRETFVRRMSEYIEKNPKGSHAVMMLDIDNFKRINDEYGHDVGDNTIAEYSKILCSTLRAVDIIGRVGGDEFMIFFPDMSFDAAITKKAEQIRKAANKHINDDITISTSIGIAVYPRDGATFDELYKNVDTALYDAKNAGKNTFSLYHSGMEMRQHAITEMDSRTVTAASEAHQILVISGSREETRKISALFGKSYQAFEACEASQARMFANRYRNTLTAIIIDIDCSFGMKALVDCGMNKAISGIRIIVLSSDCGNEMQVRCFSAGASFVIYKPINKELLLMKVAAATEKIIEERNHLQKSYQMLQKSDEERYRSIINATNTAVFIYDPVSRSYSVDDMAKHLIAGNFDGRNIADVLIQDGTASIDDVTKAMVLLKAVSKGKKSAEAKAKVKTPSGEWHWFNIQFIGLESADEMTRKILISFNDINDKAVAEEKLKFRAERDSLTGLYNTETFAEKAAELVNGKEPGYYILSCYDIDKFKVVNDRFGNETGDKLLIHIANVSREIFEKAGGICCRLNADEFAALYPVECEEKGFVNRVHHMASEWDGAKVQISISSGRYIVADTSLSISAMIDRASMAKESVKGRYDRHIAYYDEAMRDRMLKEQEVIGEMDGAITNRNFEVWFQPQYNHSTGLIIGAEALVRWRHPEKGLISPGLFIPIFEKTGFVYTLDKYVWEQVCVYLKKWLKADKNTLPVSVNVSRYDILQKDFYETITGLVGKYKIPTEVLRLEITESAFANSADRIIEMVKRLREFGFVIEIDDFGCGYSSLNTLKNVPADILKLDMRFLEDDSEDSQRGGSIVESVIRMARWLDMPVIAEGVETKQQADYLKSIGCSYIQGYYYAKPMPAPDYEALVAKSEKEVQLSKVETLVKMDSESFWDPNSLDTLVFNRFVGGACVFEYFDGTTELLRVNDKYSKIIGYGNSEEKVIGMRMVDHAPPEDRKRFLAQIEKAQLDGDEQACDLRWLRDKNDPDSLIYIRMTVRVIARADTRVLFYGIVEDVTAEKLAEKRADAAEKKLKKLLDTND